MSDNNVVVGTPRGFTVLDAHVLADTYQHPTLLSLGSKLWGSVQDVVANQPLEEGLNWTLINNGGVNFRGDYDIEETYTEFDCVVSENGLFSVIPYKSIIAGETPQIALDKWLPLLDKGDFDFGANKVLISDGSGEIATVPIELGDLQGFTDPPTFLPPVYDNTYKRVARVIAENQMAYGCAIITNDDFIYTWGYYHSTVPCFSRVNADSAIPQPLLEIDGAHTGFWVGVRTSYSSIYAWTSTGELWVSGDNGYGQLGLGTTSNTPRNLVKVAISDVREVVVVGSNDNKVSTFALKTDGTLWTCGYNGYGQLGIGTTTTTSTFTEVTAISGYVSKVDGTDSKYGGIIAMTKDDTQDNVWTWGYNGEGALGHGDTANRTTPELLVGLKAKDVRFSGHYSSKIQSSILLTNGKIVMAGNNSHGGLGRGNTTSSKVHVPQTLDFEGYVGFSTLDAYASSAYGLTDMVGKIYVWGYNGYGQLGLGNTTQQNSPVLLTIPGAGKIVKVVCTKHYNTGKTYLLDDKGFMYFAGDNAYHQSGEATTTDRSEFTKLRVSNKPIVDIKMFGRSTSTSVLALDSEGSIWASGYPGHSILGNYTENQTYTFSKIRL